MHLRLFLFAGVAPLAATLPLHAASVTTDTPPGPVTLVNLTNAPPSTPAPPQPSAKSAPGAAAPSGANGVNPNGRAVTKAPNTPPTPAEKTGAAPAPAAITNTTTASAPAAAPAPAAPAKAKASILSDYLGELKDTLKLSAEEQSEIEAFYQNDGPTLEKILNDPALSPLEQDRQVADLRNKRDTKIDDLLQDAGRRHDFSELEARYRVALLDFAAEGGLSPAPTASPAPTPNAAPPAQAEPGPATKTGAP